MLTHRRRGSASGKHPLQGERGERRRHSEHEQIDRGRDPPVLRRAGAQLDVPDRAHQGATTAAATRPFTAFPHSTAAARPRTRTLFFETEDDYQRGDEALNAMPDDQTPGRRTSVAKYDVAVRIVE